MMDEPRSHDPSPTAREREWMDGSAVEVVIRAVAMAVVAITIGVVSSHFLVDGKAADTVASAAPAQR